ncbi:ParA family protein [Roseomonas sp. USHLN139]|uniref:ParA family protein n=1 Tax=Roseomonas sp. USHLN139 TaxID=3081298 RepID=UPI003B0105C5
MAAPVVAVLNMKGGVGKTTLASNLFREVFASKKIRVLLIDLDPQFNLSQQLLQKSQYDEIASAGKTVLRLFEPAPSANFFDINVSSQVTSNIDDIARGLRYLLIDNKIRISIIAGTFELTKYSFISDGAKLSHARDFFKRTISQARNEYDLIVLDMNPSSSFLTFCGLSVATDILSPVRPDKFSMLGLELVRQLIDHPQILPKPKIHVVMNGVRRSVITDTEKEIRLSPYFGSRILVSRVYNSGVLTARSDYTGFASDRKVSNKKQVAGDLRQVGLELCRRIGI